MSRMAVLSLFLLSGSLLACNQAPSSKGSEHQLTTRREYIPLSENFVETDNNFSGFRGHSQAKYFARLMKLLEGKAKTQFETQTEYRARIQKDRMLSGVAHTLAFQVPTKNYEWEYDAEKHTLTYEPPDPDSVEGGFPSRAQKLVARDVTMVWEVARDVGQTGSIAGMNFIKAFATKGCGPRNFLRIQMRPEQAKQLVGGDSGDKSNVMIVIVGDRSPVVDPLVLETVPNISGDFLLSLTGLNLKQVFAYDVRTGDLLGKFVCPT